MKMTLDSVFPYLASTLLMYVAAFTAVKLVSSSYGAIANNGVFATERDSTPETMHIRLRSVHYDLCPIHQ
jgi:hypothetical protein